MSCANPNCNRKTGGACLCPPPKDKSGNKIDRRDGGKK